MTNLNSTPSLADELVRSGHRQCRRGQPWKNRTHCDYGHEFTPENTLIRPDKRHMVRRCRECRNRRAREYYWRRGRLRMYPHLGDVP